jgi:serine/threonine protein kinase/tetratricopeptide (TPR) repeat protein
MSHAIDDRLGGNGERFRLSAALLKEEACDQFEANLKAGQAPSIEEALAALPEDGRAALFRDLLVLELAHRRRLGESPMTDEYLARFPLYAGEVVGTFEGQRFQLLRFHAAGGLGEVYLAYDRELNREVALKQIQERHASETRSLGRFVREAEITGRLQHPGIVPVYSSGRWPEDDRPYYAMRFIDGETLKAAIARFHAKGGPVPGEGARSDAFRNLLERFIDVCEAVAYAHSEGVLHRDLKPDNVMLGGYGETLIIDWGFAKASLSRDLTTSGSPGDTLDGEVFGTPAFMSPEQAAGQVEKLTVASDVYSLGATLYYLLTGLSPLDMPSEADVRQTVDDLVARHSLAADSPLAADSSAAEAQSEQISLVRKVIRERLGPGRDSREVVTLVVLKLVRLGLIRPARAVRPGVPMALDAICSKAMVPDPSSRFVTAGELAKEIRHWLADEPVSVYRDPVTTRVLRWARKHRTRTMTAVGIFLTALFATIAIAWIKAEDNHQLEIAANKLRDTNTNLTASLGREQALRKDVESRFALAMNAIGAFHTGVSEDVHLKNPELKPLRDRLLRQAAEFYKQLAAILKERDDRSLLVEASSQLAELTASVGDPTEALNAMNETLRLGESLALEKPNDEALALRRAKLLHNAAIVHRNLGKLNEAQTTLEAGRKILDGRSDPKTEAPRRSLLAKIEVGFGIIRADAGRDGEALQHYETARSIREALRVSNPGDRGNEADLADILSSIGIVNNRRGAMAESLQRCEEGARIFRELRARDPDARDYQFGLARCLDIAGLDLVSLGQPDKALASHEEALAIQQKLSEAYPTMTLHRQALDSCREHVADAQWKAGQFREAFASYQEVVKSRKRLADEQRDVPDHRANLALAYIDLGKLFCTIGQHDDAVSQLRSGVDLLKTVVLENPKIPRYRGDLVQAKALLAQQLSQDRTRIALHPAEFAEGLALEVEVTGDVGALADEFPDVPEYQSRLATLLGNMGRFLGDRHPESALDLLEKARKPREKLARDHPDTPNYQYSLANVYRYIGDVLKGGDNRYRPDHEEGEGRTEAQINQSLVFYDKALDILRILVRDHPLDPTYKTELGAVLNNRAIVFCLDKHRHGEALEAYKEAITYQTAAYQMAPKELTRRIYLRNHLIGMAREYRDLGRIDDSVATSLQTRQIWPDDPIMLYNAAAEVAVCIPLVEKDKNRTPEEIRAEAKRLGDLAMKILQEAVDHGFDHADSMKSYDMLDPIRGRADYQALERKLE